MTQVSSFKAAKRDQPKATKRAQARQQEQSLSLTSFLALDRTTLVFSLLLVAAVLGFYSSVTHNDFVNYDDPAYIVSNTHIQEGLSWSTLAWAFTSFDEANWHPLTWLSHALDRELFGMNPAGHHWMNVLLHALNAVLLFWLLQSATGFRWRSLMVAALFALHPVNVESVAWAAERKNTLSMLFFLLALYAYVWYVRRPVLGRYAAVAGFFILSLMAKAQAVTFPFLLLLLDYWPLGRIRSGGDGDPGTSSVPQASFSSLLWEKVPLFALSAINSLVTMFAQRAARELAHYPLANRLETATVAYVRYLGKAFWPSKLVAMYPHPRSLYPPWEVAAAACLLLITVAVGLRFRQQKYLAVGWFWFLGSLVPMIGLVQVGAQAMADRYAYLSFIGIFLAVVWLVADAAVAFKVSAKWLAVPALACLLLLGGLTYRQIRVWHDSGSFWLRMIALTQDNYVAHRDLAEYLHDQNREDEAIQHLRAALAIRPDDLLSNLYAGAHEKNHGNLDSALEHFQLVADNAVKPRLRAQANTELGFVYLKKGDVEKAKRYFEISLQAVPNQAPVMIDLGVLAVRAGDLPEALRQFRHAVSLQRTDIGELLLAQALQLNGEVAKANAIRNRVSVTSPDAAAAQQKVDSLLQAEDPSLHPQ